MGGVMAWKKGESWVAAGDPTFCPLKPLHWLQRAQASLNTKRGRLVGTYFGGGGWGNKQDIFLAIATTVIFVVLVKIQQSV
eukprot:681520-Ditylum_brightwellii.AAC.1